MTDIQAAICLEHMTKKIFDWIVSSPDRK